MSLRRLGISAGYVRQQHRTSSSRNFHNHLKALRGNNFYLHGAVFPYFSVLPSEGPGLTTTLILQEIHA